MKWVFLGGSKLGNLTRIKNIGDELEAQLLNANINTYDELLKLGSKKAWLKIQKHDKSVCYNRLLALEGAIQGIGRFDLSVKDKKSLKKFYESHKL